MPKTKHTVVSIFDKKYNISTEQHDESYIQNVAKIVDDSMKLLSSSDKSLSPPQIAIIVALNLVEELLALQSDFESTESEYAVKTERLRASIGRAWKLIEVSPSDN